MDQPWWGSRDGLALSISEAARICGVKRRTIRRRHQAGEFEHAFRDPDGTWRIPVSDLVAVGLRPHVVADPDEPRIVFTAASQVDRLRTEVAVLRERVRALEIIAREREERVTDLRTILRMLPAASEVAQAGEVVERAIPPTEEPSPLQPAAEEKRPTEESIDERLSDVSRESIQPPEEVPAPVGVSSPFHPPASSAPSTEPVLILPDVPGKESEPSEGAFERTAELLENARQRSAELLEDAMSLWWPSTPAARTQPDPLASSAGRPVPAAVTVSGSDAAGTSPAVSSKAPARATMSDEPAASHSPESAPTPPAPEPARLGESDLFMRDPIDEASFDWLDPSFGRPPRHVRRRLGRFFRRHRKPP